ncbi:Tat pathway signal sequence domain protein [Streptomyces sp. NBC_00503]|uniref:Tat pathway signal sequence domain protein n=1 Tax=Streptomyces sp. NBC_00503 TaxID=2903659 RepID=UPI002E81D68B|nr:Tat pathway signal sequence domain protein [Streptomyces sp. NBC_00503]WUD80762.1 Tat pathway signal sequence domain protein [Streptomyces sp. NBC_00503]
MSGGIGPIEPGEGTEAHESPRPAPRTPRPPRWAHRAYEGHRRAVLVATALICASGVAAGGAALYAARPRPAPYTPPAPSQVFSLTYLGPVDPVPAGSAFAFTVRVRTTSGPPVTLERLSQSSGGLTAEVGGPPLPATVAAGEVLDLVVRIRVTDCVHVARNSGLPFLEVTLSNKFQKEEHGYIPGDRYARDLSVALTRACPEGRDAGTSSPS